MKNRTNKSTWKRALCALLSCALLLSLAACGGKSGGEPSGGGDGPSGGSPAGGGGTDRTDGPEGAEPSAPLGPVTTTITYRGDEVEVVELPQIALSDLHATPLEGDLVSAESAQEGQIKVYTLGSTGQADPGNHGTKDGMTYFLAESSLDIGTSLELHSYHVENGVRAEKREHNNAIKVRPGSSSIGAFRLFDRDMSEYEVDFKQYDLEKYQADRTSELAAARVYRGMKDPSKLYVFVDAITETRIEGAMMVLLVKDGVIVNSVSWDGFGTISGDSRTVDWRFTFEEEYDSVYVQLDVNAYNDGETFG